MTIREIASAEALCSLPQWVVLRTATNTITERNPHSLDWKTPGSEGAYVFGAEDFPAHVLWSAADESDQAEAAKAAVEAEKVLGQLMEAMGKQNAVAPSISPTSVLARPPETFIAG